MKFTHTLHMYGEYTFGRVQRVEDKNNPSQCSIPLVYNSRLSNTPRPVGLGCWGQGRNSTRSG